MKLPINPLLYLVSLASLASIGNSVYTQYAGAREEYDKKKVAEIAKEDAFLKRKGEEKLPDEERWQYGIAWFWLQFRDANFTGKVPVVKVEEKPTEAEVKPKVEEIIQITDILRVICITSVSDDSRTVVEYSPGVEVEVPDGFQSTTAATAPGPRDMIPRGRRGTRNIPRPTPQPTSGIPPQHLMVGEALWKPYDYIFLKSIAPDASSVTFELRIDEKKTPEGYPSQSLLPNALGLREEILRALSAGGLATGEVPARPSTKSSDQPGSRTASMWEDVEETKVVRGNNVIVSEKDRDYLEKNGTEIFTNDVVMQDYSGGSGASRVRGVQLRKISPKLGRFGAESGDVVISLNGQEVRGMAHAKKLGRRLYDDGVRSFRAEVLRQGRIVTLTYHFKDKK